MALFLASKVQYGPAFDAFDAVRHLTEHHLAMSATCSHGNGLFCRMEGQHLLRRHSYIPRRVTAGLRSDVGGFRLVKQRCQRPAKLDSAAGARGFFCKAKQTDSLTPASLNIGGLESTKVPGDLRTKVEAAVEASLNRLEPGVTVGDVSAAAGVTVSQAETVLNALAYDTQGTLEVKPACNVLNKPGKSQSTRPVVHRRMGGCLEATS